MSEIGTGALVGQMIARLPDVIIQLRQRLISKASAAEVYYPTLREDFALLFAADTLSVSLGGAEGGAFQFNGRELVFDPAPLSSLLRSAMDDVERAANLNGMVLAEAEYEDYLESVAVIYILHELRHPQQGIGDYDQVVALKKTASGRVALAMFDLHADRDAVALWAALSTAESGGDRAAYLKLFRTWLFVTAAVSVCAFPYTMEKTAKLGRAVGLSIMVGRLALADSGYVEPGRLSEIPLDSVIEVLMDDTIADVSFLATNPRRVIVSMAAPELEPLVKHVLAGRFDAAIEHASALWRRAA